MSTESNSQNKSNGVVSGVPNLVLRGEGLLVLIGATYAYSLTMTGWLSFAVLFFVPDVFMLGYLHNNKTGAAFYNLGHTYLMPGALLLLAHVTGQSTLLGISLIWIAHIGFDRVIGYGLKYGSGFRHTHLS